MHLTFFAVTTKSESRSLESELAPRLLQRVS